MSGQHWTIEQKNFMIENLGILSYGTIGNKLGKTGRAVRQKRIRMETEQPKDILDYVTIKFLAKAIHSTSRTIKKWIENKGLKAMHKNIETKRIISRIKLENFWEWAEENQKSINWNEFSIGSLGAEPKWTRETRTKCKRKRITWTTKKENLLESYYKIGLTPHEIAKNMGLTTNAVRSRHNLIKKRYITY